MNHYKNEFPNFDYELPDLGKGWEDNSWHNDVCPSLDFPLGGEKIVRVWFDYADPEMRECGGKQFVLAVGIYGDSMDHVLESDNLDEILNYIKVHKLTNLYECFWGEGYRGDDDKSIISYNDLEFFNEDRGYEPSMIIDIRCLDVGEVLNLNCITGEHWVRRMK